MASQLDQSDARHIEVEHILYNRGVYPEESFTKVKKYGLSMLLTQDEGVKSFIPSITSQLSEWLESGKLQRVVLVIMSKATSQVFERWNFNIETDSEVVEKAYFLPPLLVFPSSVQHPPTLPIFI
ncbi:Mitotic spindle checkpoint component mad2 [Asimina triloba]